MKSIRIIVIPLLCLILIGFAQADGLKFIENELIFDQNRIRAGYIKKYKDPNAGLMAFDNFYKLDTLIKFSNPDDNILQYVNQIKCLSLTINSRKIFLFSVYKETPDSFSIILYTDAQLNFSGYFTNNKVIQTNLVNFMKHDMKPKYIKKLPWYNYFLGNFIQEIETWTNRGVIVHIKTRDIEGCVETKKFNLYYEFINNQFKLKLSMYQRNNANIELLKQ